MGIIGGTGGFGSGGGLQSGGGYTGGEQAGDTGGKYEDPSTRTGGSTETARAHWIGYVGGVKKLEWLIDFGAHTQRNAEAELQGMAMVAASATKGVAVEWKLFFAASNGAEVFCSSGSEKVDAEVTVLPDTGPVITPGDGDTGGDTGGDMGDWPLKLFIIAGLVAVAVWFLFLRGKKLPALPALPAAPTVASIPVPISEAKI